MFRSTWMCESTFSTVNFMESKYRAITDDSLASELRHAVTVKHTLDFKDLVWKKDVNYLNIFYTDYMLKYFRCSKLNKIC